MDILEFQSNKIDSTSGYEEKIQEKIEKVIAALDSNPHMTDKGFVKDVVSLSADFVSRFSGVDIENYLERLKSVNVLYFGKYTYKDSAIKYLPNDNIIMVNKDKIIKGNVDIKHALMKIVIAMATTNKITYYLNEEDKNILKIANETFGKINTNPEEPKERCFYGFDNDESLTALNEGFLDLTARALVGDGGESGFKQEREIVDFIGKRIGVEPFIEAFFTNQPQVLMTSLLQRFPDKKALENLLEQINYNMSTKKVDEEFIPVKLESQLLKAFGNVELELMI